MDSFNSIFDSPSKRFLHFFTTTQPLQYPTSSIITPQGTKRRLSSTREDEGDETNPSQLKKRIKTNPRTKGEENINKDSIKIASKKMDSKTGTTNKMEVNVPKVSGKMATNSKTRDNKVVRPPWKP